MKLAVLALILIALGAFLKSSCNPARRAKAKTVVAVSR